MIPIILLNPCFRYKITCYMKQESEGQLPTPISEDIMRRIICENSDENLWTELIQHKASFVSSVISLYSDNFTKEDIEDLTQETFIKLFSKYHLYDPNLSLENWIAAIAINTARDAIRRQKRQNTIPFPDPIEGSDFESKFLAFNEKGYSFVECTEEAAIILANVDICDINIRDFLLHVINGLSYREICEINGGANMNTIKGRIKRGRDHIITATKKLSVEE
jgi:RNA polymerase sigma factor (sigma-70 family)